MLQIARRESECGVRQGDVAWKEMKTRHGMGVRVTNERTTGTAKCRGCRDVRDEE